MNHEAWMSELIGDDSQRVAALKVGTTHSTISRQLTKGKLDPELVIALARAYGANEVDALVDTGYVDPDAVGLAGIPTALGHASNEQILEEIRKRTDPDAVRLLRGGGDPNVITPRFGHRGGEGEQPMAARHGEKGVPDYVAPGEENQVHPDDD